MATDLDIQLGEVTTRAPETADRPDQDREVAVMACGQPPADGLRVYIALDAFEDMETHAHCDTSVELGGVLLGRQCLDNHNRPFVVISETLRARHYQSTASRFTYTHDTFSAITREKDTVAPDLDIVGWYHTHPGWGIFLSGHDTFIHENFFAQPLDVAYVIDPVNQQRGLFAWSDAALVAANTPRTVSEPSPGSGRLGGLMAGGPKARASSVPLVGSEGNPPPLHQAEPAGPPPPLTGRRLPEVPGFYLTAPRRRRAALEETIARVEGRRLTEALSHNAGGSTAPGVDKPSPLGAGPAGDQPFDARPFDARHLGGTTVAHAGPGSPIIIHTGPAPETSHGRAPHLAGHSSAPWLSGTAFSGRAVIVAVLAIWSLVILAQTAVLLVLARPTLPASDGTPPATRSASGWPAGGSPSASGGQRIEQLEADNAALRRRLLEVSGMGSSSLGEAALAGAALAGAGMPTDKRPSSDRELLRIITADLKIDGAPFLRRAEAMAEEIRLLRDRLREAEATTRLATAQATDKLQEALRLRDDLETSRRRVRELEDLRLRAEERLRRIDDLEKSEARLLAELERIKPDAQRYLDSADELKRLDENQAAYHRWWRVALLVELPVLIAGWLVALMLFRKWSHLRSELDHMASELASALKVARSLREPADNFPTSAGFTAGAGAAEDSSGEGSPSPGEGRSPAESQSSPGSPASASPSSGSSLSSPPNSSSGAAATSGDDFSLRR